MTGRVLSISTISISSRPTTLTKSKTSLPLLNIQREGFTNSILSFSRPSTQKHRLSVISESSLAPTVQSEETAVEKPPRWSARATKAFAVGLNESKKLKYHLCGTESLLIGILVEGTSHASKFLRSNGFTVMKVQHEIIELIGKSHADFLGRVSPPLTRQAHRAIEWAVDAKMKSGKSGEVTTTHLLLGIWSQKDSAGHKVMAKLGFDDEKAAELAKVMDVDVISDRYGKPTLEKCELLL